MDLSVLLLHFYGIHRRFKDLLRDLWNLISYYGVFKNFMDFIHDF